MYIIEGPRTPKRLVGTKRIQILVSGALDAHDCLHLHYTRAARGTYMTEPYIPAVRISRSFRVLRHAYPGNPLFLVNLAFLTSAEHSICPIYGHLPPWEYLISGWGWRVLILERGDHNIFHPKTQSDLYSRHNLGHRQKGVSKRCPKGTCFQGNPKPYKDYMEKFRASIFDGGILGKLGFAPYIHLARGDLFRLL